MGWQDNYTWVTCNVISLYTCIPHKALIALSFHLRKIQRLLVRTQGIKFGYHCFYCCHTIFLVFNNTIYLQVCGCPMGAFFHLLLQISTRVIGRSVVYMRPTIHTGITWCGMAVMQTTCSQYGIRIHLYYIHFQFISILMKRISGSPWTITNIL